MRHPGTSNRRRQPRAAGASGPDDSTGCAPVGQVARFLGLTEPHLERVLDQARIPVRRAQIDGIWTDALTRADYLRLRLLPDGGIPPRRRLAALRPVSPAEPTPPTDGEAPWNDPTFELEILAAQCANGRERLVRLEDTLGQRVAELETVQAELEIRRGRDGRRTDVAARLRLMRRAVDSSRRELVSMRARFDQSDAFRAEIEEDRAACREALRHTVDAYRSEVSALHGALHLEREAREKLASQLELAREVECANARYCDRLERNLEAARRVLGPDAG